MVKLISSAGRRSGRLFVLATLTGLLASCGGGSGDGDIDVDEDGVSDFEDPFIDLDGDGLDDLKGLTEAEAEADLDGDGIVNGLDSDADGDGDTDISQTFVDLNEDGLDDRSGLTEEQAIAQENNALFPTPSQPCGNQPSSATDNDSSTADWGDNCHVGRATLSEAQGALLADSLYSAGIQRVLFCLEHGTGTDYRVFADGEYGPGTETAMISFQNDPVTGVGLTADGLVGPATWGALEDTVEELVAGTIGNNGGVDTMGFTSGPCMGIPMFYQATSFGVNAAGDQVVVRGGWTLARNQPNEAQSVQFSYQLPFGRL